MPVWMTCGDDTRKQINEPQAVSNYQINGKTNEATSSVIYNSWHITLNWQRFDDNT